MSFLAQRLQAIKPSPTLAMSARANVMKASGIDVINLSAGEPDFDTPDFIKETAIRALDQGLTKYTAADGMPTLKKAIQDKLLRDNKLHYDISQIVVGNGGKQVIFNAFLATLNPGDEVIVPAPYWVSYPDISRLFEGTVIEVPCKASQGFKLSPVALEQAITLRSKWLILNAPSNPTGAVYTAEELAALAEVLRRYPQLLILSDDIYEYLVYDNLPFHTLATVAPDLQERILIVNGVSKSCSMTGWRIGYGAGPAPLIKAMAMLQSQSTSNACSIAQAAAVAAINGPHDFLPEWRATFTKRRDLCLDALNRIPGLTCMKPGGAFYLYIDCQGIIGKTTPHNKVLQTDDGFCNYLLEDAHVALVSGSGFGLSPYLRLSYAVSEEALMQGCRRIEKAVLQLSVASQMHTPSLLG